MSNKIGRPNKVSGIVMENRGMILHVNRDMLTKQHILTKTDLGKDLSRPSKLVALDFVAMTRCKDGSIMAAINMRKATVQEYGRYVRNCVGWRNDPKTTTRLYSVTTDGRVRFNLPKID